MGKPDIAPCSVLRTTVRSCGKRRLLDPEKSQRSCFRIHLSQPIEERYNTSQLTRTDLILRFIHNLFHTAITNFTECSAICCVAASKRRSFVKIRCSRLSPGRSLSVYQEIGTHILTKLSKTTQLFKLNCFSESYYSQLPIKCCTFAAQHVMPTVLPVVHPKDISYVTAPPAKPVGGSTRRILRVTVSFLFSIVSNYCNELP